MGLGRDSSYFFLEGLLTVWPGFLVEPLPRHNNSAQLTKVSYGLQTKLSVTA